MAPQNDTQIASISIGSSLDLSGFYADLDRLNKDFARSAKLPTLRPIVDDRALVNLNKHFKLKATDAGKLNDFLRLNPITPQVNLAPALRQLDEFDRKLKSLQGRSINIQLGLSEKAERGYASTEAKNSEALRDLARSMEKLEKAISSRKAGGTGGVLTGISQQFGFTIGSALQSALKSNFGLDLGKRTKAVVSTAAQPVKLFITENPELKKTLDKLSDEAGQKFRKAGYKVGDGIVAALEEGGSARNRFDAFTKEVFDSKSAKDGLENLKKDTTKAVKDIGRAIAREDVLAKVFDRAGSKISAYRDVALDERAIPLVKKRALEILNQEKKTNSARQVNEDTEQFIIATGGYAGAEGKSGAALARSLKQDKSIKNAKVAYVENVDTDISESSTKSKPTEFLKKLGLDLGAEWIGAVGTSLAKPNLRGYSKDAVEIAAQALAAKEINTRVKIKIVGESGGGFAAEEAQKILQKLGIDDSEFIGVGTPNFFGRLNAKGTKVMSPDESLGLFNQVASRYGLSDTSPQSQGVLGVGNHPYRFYKESKNAELENFLYGKPESLDDKAKQGIYRDAQVAKKTDLSGLSPKQLEEVSKVAFDNYEYLRRHMLDANEEIDETIKESAAIYKKIYLQTAKEPGSFKAVREKIRQSSILFSRLASSPGLESSIKADEIRKELEETAKAFKELTTKYDGTLGEYVGTLAQKRDELVRELEGNIERFSSPDLGIKKSIPKPLDMPLVVRDQPEKGLAGSPQAIAGGLAKQALTATGNAITRVAETAGDAAEKAIVTRINALLAQIPGQKDVLDANPRRIDRLSDLTPEDYMHLSKVGASDLAGNLIETLTRANAIAKGIESIVLDVTPMGRTAKGVIQNVALPAAAFTAATHMLPGGAAIAGGAQAGMEGMLSLPAGALADAMTGMVGEAVTQSIASIPLVGAKLAPAMTQAIVGLIEGSISAATQMGAAAATPVLGGQILLGAGKAAGEAILPSGISKEEQQILIASTRKQLKGAQESISKAAALLPGQPSIAKTYIQVVEDNLDIPQLSARIDEAIAALPSADRMATEEGSQLANLKSQITKTESKLDMLLNGLKQMATRPGQLMQESVYGDAIDVDFTEITPSAQLPGSSIRSLPASKDSTQQYIDQAKQSLKAVGQQFSAQVTAMKETAAAPKVSQRIAREIEIAAADARAAIDALMAELGSDASKDIKAIASTARGQITKAEKKATNVLKPAREAGVEVGAGFNQGLSGSIAAVESAAQGMAQAAIDAAEDTLGIQSPSTVFKYIGQMISTGLELGMNGFQGAGAVFDEFTKNAEESGNELLKTLGGVGQIAKFAVGGFLAFQGLQFVWQQFSQISDAINEAAKSMERLEARFKFNFGSQGEAVLGQVTQNAIALRQDINSARDSYLQLAAATKDTPLELSTDLASQALNQAGLVYGLNADEQRRLSLAEIQISSKGKLSAEEVRGQESEALAGSTAIRARSQGMSVQEFSKKLDQGAFSAEDSQPKFYAQLIAETAVGVPDAANTASAAVTNLNNNVRLLQESLGKPFLPVQKVGLDVLALMAGNAANALSILSEIVLAATVAALGKFTLSLAANTSAGGIWASTQGLMTAALKGFTAFLTQPATSIAGLTVGLIGIVEVAKIFGKAFSDAGGEARRFADAATESMRKYQEAIGNAPKKDDISSRLKESYRTLTEDLTKGESLLEGTLFGSIFGKDLSRIVERGGQSAIDLFNQSLGAKSKVFTYEDKKKQDRDIAGNEAIGASNTILSEMMSLLPVAGARLGASNPIAQVKALNDQIKELQLKRQQLDPADTIARKNLDEQERKLNNQKQPLDQRIRMLTAQNATAIESFKRLRDEAERMGDINGVTKYQAQLEAAQKVQDSFNKTIEGTIVSVTELAAQFELIQGKLQESNDQISMFGAQARGAIASRQLSGQITPGQSQFQQYVAAQSVNTQQIQAAQKAISETIAKLQDIETQRVLSQSGFNLESSPSDIRAKTALMGDSPEKDRLNQSAEQLDVVRSKRVEIENLETQIKEARIQAQESVRQASQQVQEFMRSVQRQAEDLSQTIEGMRIGTIAQNAKNQFRQALSGFTNRFTGEFVDGVLSLIDMLYEPMKRLQEAQAKIAGSTRSLQDLGRQGVELGRSSYSTGSGGGAVGGETVEFRGIQVTSAVDASGEPGLDYVVSNGDRGAQFGAVAAGEVIETVTDQNWENNMGYGGVDTGQRGSGNQVIIRARDEVTGEFVDMLYAHLDSVAVQVGQKVGVGTVLGTQGRTGSTTGAHVSLDFYGEGSYSASSASLAMRDRIANELASGAPNLNASIATAAPAPTSVAAAPSTQGAVNLSESEAMRLALLSSLEATTSQGELDVAQSVFNRLNSGNYGNSLDEVMFAEGQYEPFFGTSLSQLQNKDQILSYAQSKGISEADLRDTIERMANPQLMTDAAQHVGGRTDFKGVSQYGNRVASEDPLRVDGENYFHIGGNQTYEQLAALARQSPTSVAVGGYGAATPGAGGAQYQAQINQRIGEYSQIAQSFRAETFNELAAVDQAAAIEFDRALKQAGRGLETKQQELQSEVRDLERRQQDMLNESIGSTQFGQYLTQRLEGDRQLEDATRSRQIQIRDVTEGLEELEFTREQLTKQLETARAAGADPALIGKLELLIPKNDAAIATFRDSLAELETLYGRESAIYQQRADRLAADLKRQQSIEIGQELRRSAELRIQQSVAGVRDSALQGVLQSRSQLLDIGSRYDDEMSAIEVDLQRTQDYLKQLQDEGIAIDSTQVVETTAEIDRLNAKLERLKDQQSIEVEIVVEQRDRALREYYQQNSQEAQSQLVSAQATAMNSRGNTFGANNLQRNYGLYSEQMRYQKERSEFLSDQALLPEEMRLQGGDLESYLSTLQQINSVNLENVRGQFKDLGDSLGDIATQGFGGFISGIPQILDGTKSIGQAFEEMADQILNQIFQLLSQMAMSGLQDLLGGTRSEKQGAPGADIMSMFGGGGQSSGGGLGGILGSVFSIGTSIFGGGAGAALAGSKSALKFKDGGEIPGYYDGNDDQHIARVNPGEFIFSREAVKAIGVPTLKAWNKMPRFKDGGYVAPGRFDRTPSFREGDSDRSSNRDFTIKHEVTKINGVEYVTRSEFEEGTREAARRGAEQGHRATMGALKDKRSARKSIGLS